MARENRRDRRSNRDREERDELDERVVHIARTAKVVKGGRRFAFRAVVVVGDQKGKVGVGVGKARGVPEAIRKASDREQESLRIAGETAAALREIAAGVKIQTLGWEHRLPEILDYAGI